MSDLGEGSAAFTPEVRGPLAAYQRPMPAQYGFRLDQKAVPRCSSEALSKGGEQHTIRTRPPDTLDLPLEDLNLAAQNQHLSLQAGSVAPAHHDRLNDDAKEQVEHRADHGGDR